MPVTLPLVDQKPACFADKWDPDDPTCAGGLDPAYIDPETKERRRPQCDFFESCGGRTRLRLLAEDTRPIYRGGIHHNGDIAAQVRQRLHTYPTPPTLYPRQAAPQSYAAPERRTYPQQSHQVVHDGGAPPFLAVPEVRAEEDSFMSFALRTAFRSSMKGLFMGIAHLFDTTTIKPPR